MAVPHDLHWRPWSRIWTGCLWECPLLQTRKLCMVRDVILMIWMLLLACDREPSSALLTWHNAVLHKTRGCSRHRTVKGQKPHVRGIHRGLKFLQVPGDLSEGAV